MIERMTTTPGMPDGAPRPAPAEAVRTPAAPATPKAPDAAQVAANTALAGAIEADLTANPPRIDAGLADAAGLTSQETTRTGLSPQEIQELGTNAAVFIRDHPLPEQTGMFQETTYTQDDLMVARRNELPVEIGQRFDAHGIAKGGYKDQLSALNTLLTTGIDPSREFHSVPLKHPQEIEAAVAMGAAGPYDTGNFIVIGNPDGQLRDGIGGVIVNEAFYDAIPRLQEAYPGVKFIRADQMTEGLGEMINPSNLPETSPQSAGNVNLPEGFTAGPPRLETVGPDHIYDHPDLDPELTRFQAQIIEKANGRPEVQNADPSSRREKAQAARDIEEMNGWDAYLARYPEKSKAYAEKGHHGLSEAIARKAKRDATSATAPESVPAPTTAEANRTGLSSDEVQVMAGKAQRFIEEHPNELVDGEEFPYDPYMLVDTRRSIPPELASQFDAHGIAKGTTQDLVSLNNLLTNGIDQEASFFTANLDSKPNAAAISVKDNGSFIVLGKPGQSLKDGGIAGVIVHEAYYDAIPRLQEAFPNVKFIKASEANQGLSEMISASQGNPEPSPTSPQDQLIGNLGEDGETEEHIPDYVFGNEFAAIKAMRDAEAKGNLSVADRETLEAKIAEGRAKDEILNLNLSVVDAQNEAAMAGKKSSSSTTKAKEARNEAYKNIFKARKAYAKKAGREYSEILGDMLQDARNIRDGYESEYQEALKSNDLARIELAKRRRDAAQENFSMIKKEKRKNLLKGLLSSMAQVFIATSVSETGKQVKGGIQQPPHR